MPQSSARRPHHLAIDLFSLLVVYFFVTSLGLGRYPTPWVDEGWIGEVAAQVAAGHPLGNPSHGALYRYADRVFWMPHLQFELLGAWFRAAGVSLVGGRLLSVALGAGTALLLFIFLRRRFTRPAAWLGTLLFITDTFAWKAARTIRFEPTLTLLFVGLVLCLDVAMDRAAARRGAGRGYWLLAGALLALMINVHPNAALLAAAAVAFVLVRGGLRALATPGPWLALGVGALGALPPVAYLLGDAPFHYANLAGQNSFHFGAHGRTGFVVLNEWRRYADYFPWPARTPAALGWLAILLWGLLHAGRPEVRGLMTLLAVPLLGLACLPNKSLLYLTTELPFAAALAAAWISGPGRRAEEHGGPEAGEARPAGGWRAYLGRPAPVLAVLLILAGMVVDAALLYRNRDSHPESVFAALRARLQPGDRVAGTFVTWWAAQPLPFREFHRVDSLEDLRAFRPTVVLLGDKHWVEAGATKFAQIARPVEAWVKAEGRLEATISDPALGDIRLYRVNGTGDPKSLGRAAAREDSVRAAEREDRQTRERRMARPMPPTPPREIPAHLPTWFKTWQAIGWPLTIDRFRAGYRVDFLDPGLPVASAFDPHAAAFRDRASILAWSPDSSRALDPYATLGIERHHGYLVNLGGDVDVVAVLYDLGARQATRFLSCGTPCTYDEAVWLDDSRIVVAGRHSLAPGDGDNRSKEWMVQPVLYVISRADSTGIAYLAPAIPARLFEAKSVAGSPPFRYVQDRIDRRLSGPGVPPSTSRDLGYVEFAFSDYRTCVRRMEHARLAARFAPDGVLDPAGGTPVRGPAAIRALLEARTDRGVLAYDAAIDSVSVDARGIRTFGTFTETTRGATGDTLHATGRFAAEWMRESDNKWLLRRMTTRLAP